MSFSDYLRSQERKTGQKQTHTWFGAPSRVGFTTKTLHVEQPSELRRQLLAYVNSSSDLAHGCNSVSEKVTSRFRFFTDVDVKAEAIRDWAANGKRPQWKTELVKLLQHLCSTCQEVATEVIGESEPTRIIVASRLPYKLHFHFPDIITDKDHAKKLCAAMQAKLADDVLFSAAFDESVYSTGLRLIWCHKGSMANVKDGAQDKMAAEKAIHEGLFGKGTWTGYYSIIDESTWKRKTVKTMEDLEVTSIVAGEEAKLTPMRFPDETRKRTTAVVRSSGGRVASKKRVGGSGGGGGEVAVASSSKDNGVPQELATTICNAFSLAPDELNWVGRAAQGDYVTLPTRSRDCEFAGRTHASNHVYLVLSPEGVDLRCHDQECTQTRMIKREAMSPQAALELDAELGVISSADMTDVTDDMRSLAVVETLNELRKLPEGRNLDLRVDPERIYRADVGDEDTWYCDLPNNRFCIVCNKEHDEAQNCVLVTMRRLKLLCYKDRFRNNISIPLLERHGNIIFANQIVNNNNLNITVNNGVEGDIRDFGTYDTFPKLHEDEALNQLRYRTLTGTTYDIARYGVGLLQGKYVFQDLTWYWYSEEEGYWRSGITPDDLLTGDVSDSLAKLMDTYSLEKQVRWLCSLRNDLGNINRRKAFIEDMERQLVKHARRVPLGEQTHLIGFQNGCYDSKECVFREKGPDDYLTTLIPYDLPSTVDVETRQHMERVMADIMPDDEVRQFLMTMLALHLEGINRHDIAMIWTGVGGNGKGFLKGLMDKAFGPMHREPPATFLTSERPSADKPNPDLIDVKETRSLFTSEPQAGRKINSGFLKYITGRDPIRIRNVHSGTFVEYIPRFLVTLLCNVIPLIEGGDEDVRGIWRRLKIIHFGTIFKSNPNPDRPNEKRADPMLGEKSASWGPQFMLWLMEIYEAYVREGRTIEVPQEVEANLQEQKDENSPFDAWLDQNMIGAPGKRIHPHRFENAYNFGKKKEDQVPRGIASNKLVALGVQKAMKRNKDAGCCDITSAIVLDVDVRGWDESSKGVRSLQ